MKISSIKYIAFAVSLCLLTQVFISCDDYLDADELDDRPSVEEIFKSEATALRFLADVYRFMRVETNWSNSSPWTGISDELDVTYQDYGTSRINNGSMLASSPEYDYWSSSYRGIRNATFFMQNIEQVVSMQEDRKDQPPVERLLKYKAEARYLRAHFYFNIFQQYGPAILLYDEIIPSDAPIEKITIARSTVSETVEYIKSELDSLISQGHLPEHRGSYGQIDIEYGRVTVAACKALKARLLLYAASDFYNADLNSYCGGLKNKDGKLLFDYTNADKEKRWKAAAEAAKEVINMGYFNLYKENDSGGNIDAYESYRNLFQKEWNDEVIFGKRNGSFDELDKACSPRMLGTNAWNGWAPTQHVVDAYFTINGLDIKDDPMYNETGFTSSASDLYGGWGRGTFNMYINREPRFYASIAFNNCKWIANNNKNLVQFYMGGNSGYHEKNNARNFSRTGYLAKKFVSPLANLSSSVSRNYIYFRLGEVYLNYAEALCELSNFDANKEEILFYLNEIRKRAGIPTYGDATGQIKVNGQAHLKELIRKERRVELAFESHRYFDCKRWIISHETDGGEFWGMNVYAGEADFHKRTVFEIRSFQPKNYLWPLKTDETYKNTLLVQNPGWSTLE